MGSLICITFHFAAAPQTQTCQRTALDLAASERLLALNHQVKSEKDRMNY